MDAPTLAAWLKARLSSAEDDWARLLGAMYRQLLATPADQVVDRQKVRAVIEQHLVAQRVEDLVRVGFRVGVRPTVAAGRDDERPVGRWMPEEAQRRLAALAGQPHLVGEVWIEELFKQDAAEELLSETLYQSLKDFSTLVPRILQKVLPSGLGRLAGFAANAGSKMFDEVERVLDGEIRRFLEKGAGKALDRAARFAAQNVDSPTMVEGRRNMVRFALSKSGAFHVERMTDDRIDELEAIAELTAAHIATHEETAAVIDRLADRVWAAVDDRTVGEALDAAGITSEPPFEAWAAATWPALRTALQTPEVEAWIDDLAREFFERP